MPSARVDAELQRQVEQFLYEEAWLLDQGRFDEWLDLFTDDVRYWMPSLETVQGRDEPFPVEGELAVALFDDDKHFLTKRVQRLATGLAHSEQPRSRTRHLITNVQVASAEERELTVRSSILVYQGRLEQTEALFVGWRDDRLRPEGESWKIARRKIMLDHALLPRVLSIFF